MLGGGPDHDRRVGRYGIRSTCATANLSQGFRYWKSPGAFKERYITGDAGRFLALWSTFVTATFAYLGTELVGVTVGEAQNPRKVIPKAIKLTFWRILIFYVLSVLLIGTLVPYNDKLLSFATKQTPGASASPFVVAIIEAGIPVLPSIMNGSILLFVFSASNSDLYIATRTLYGLAKEGKCFSIFAHTDRRGVPIYSLGLSALISLIAFLNVGSESTKVFGYFVNLVTIFGLLVWISILVTHICFLKARAAQGITNDQMAYVAPLGIYGTYFALGFCILIAIFKNFDVFIYSKTRDPGLQSFDYRNFITGYLGIPLYLGMIAGYKLIYKQPGKTPFTADLFSGKDIIDREEEAYLAKKAIEGRKNGWYRFISWLF